MATLTGFCTVIVIVGFFATEGARPMAAISFSTVWRAIGDGRMVAAATTHGATKSAAIKSQDLLACLRVTGSYRAARSRIAIMLNARTDICAVVSAIRFPSASFIR